MLLNDVQQVKNIIILFSVGPVCGTNHTQYAKHNTTNTPNKNYKPKNSKYF